MKLSDSLAKILFLTLLVLVAWGFHGCEECVDCEPRKSEPGIRVSFFADATLSETQMVLDSLVLVLKANRALLDTIPAEFRDTLALAIESQKTDSSLFALRISHFKSGTTFMDEIGGIGTQTAGQISDTLINRDFILPLNMNSDKSVYYFQYYDRLDTLALDYVRTIDQNLDGVRMKISNLSIDSNLTSFSIATLRCRKSNCSNNTSILEIYF